MTVDRIALTFEVTAKVEALRLDGDTAHTFQGRLTLEGGSGEPLNMALVIPTELWEATDPGDVLYFELANAAK